MDHARGRGRAALLSVALLLLAQRAYCDGVTGLMNQLERGVDPQDCGQLQCRCCMRKPADQRCNSPLLTCVSLINSAQNLQCQPCGDEGQPACANTRCNQDLQPSSTDSLPYKICLPVQQSEPRFFSQMKMQQGGTLDRMAKKKQENDIGRAIRPEASCTHGASCKGGRTCLGGVCVACGGLGQPCCSGAAAPCTQYDSTVAVRCVRDDGQQASVCRLAAGQQ